MKLSTKCRTAFAVLQFTIVLLLLLLATAAPGDTETELLELRLHDPMIRRSVTLTEALSLVGTHLQEGFVLFGMEIDMTGGQEPRVDLNLPAKCSLKDALALILQPLPGYRAEVVGSNLIHVYPAWAEHDPDNVLNLKVAHFDVLNEPPSNIVSRPEQFIPELDRHLREEKGIKQGYFPGGLKALGPGVTLHLRDVSIREVLNAVTQAALDVFPPDHLPGGWVYRFRSDVAPESIERHTWGWHWSMPSDWKARRQKGNTDTQRKPAPSGNTLLRVNAPLAAGQGTSGDAVLNARVRHFELTDQTLFDGLAVLSSEPVRLAIGFESVLKAKFADPPILDPRFSLQLENRTIREILDTLCSMDSRFTWSQDGRTINVFPRSTIGDPSYLLNRKLDKLAIKAITDIEQGLLAIVQQLPSPKEQVAIAQVGGDFSYPPQPWTTSFRDLTLRQAINRLATHIGPRGSWTFFGSPEFRTFSFHKTAFQHMQSEAGQQEN